MVTAFRKWLRGRRRSAVTIGIGELFRFGSLKGALVCADSKIVSSDLATTAGSKVHLSLSPSRSAFAIADAA